MFENRIYKRRGDVKGGDAEEGKRYTRQGVSKTRGKSKDVTNRWTEKKKGKSDHTFLI